MNDWPLSQPLRFLVIIQMFWDLPDGSAWNVFHIFMIARGMHPNFSETPTLPPVPYSDLLLKCFETYRMGWHENRAPYSLFPEDGSWRVWWPLEFSCNAIIMSIFHLGLRVLDELGQNLNARQWIVTTLGILQTVLRHHHLAHTTDLPIKPKEIKNLITFRWASATLSLLLLLAVIIFHANVLH